MQELIADVVLGRPRRDADLMERLRAAADGSAPAAETLEAALAEMSPRMPIDQISIAVAHSEEGQFTDLAAIGIDVPGREAGARAVLDGSLVEASVSGGAALRVDGDSVEALESRYPALKPELDAGLRSWLSIPLRRYGRPIGALTLASRTLRAYTDDHVRLGELVGEAVSGAAGAGAWLSNLEHAGALEEDALAGLGRLLLSSKLDEAYAALADGLRKVAAFDLLAVVLTGPEQASARTAFAVGLEEETWSPSETYRVEAEALENLVGREGRLITDESPELLSAVVRQWPPLAGKSIRAVAAAPLPSTRGHTGALVLASTTSGSLTQSRLAPIRQAAAMLSGCVEREGLLRQRAARDREEDGLAEMGRAVSQADGLDAALASAAAILKRLVPVDRIEIASTDGGRLLYASGEEPYIGAPSLASLTLDAGDTVTVATPEALERFPALRPYVQAGQRSFMGVPLAYGGEAVGSLGLGANAPDAFAGRKREVVLRAAAHVAGAISARTAAARLVEAEGRERALAELSSAIAAAADSASLLKAAAPPLQKLVPYDRLDAFAIAGDASTVMLHSTGIPLDARDAGAAADAAAEALAQAEAPLLMSAGAVAAYTNAGIHSVLALPITGGGGLTGGVALGSTTQRAYHDAHLETGRLAANMLAGPLHGMTARAEHETARKEIEVIAEIGRVAASTLDVREVYGKLADLIGALLLYDRLSIWTADLRRESLAIAFTAGGGETSAEGAGQVRMSSRELLGVLTSGEAATGNRAEELSQKIFGPLNHSSTALPAVLLAPLIAGEETVGLLSLSTARPNTYTPHDAALAEMIASQLAGPIANAQMHVEYKQVEESVREAVQRLERAVAGSGDGLWDWNISAGEVWWSPRLVEMIGVDGPAGAGGVRGLETRVHPGDRERVLQCLSEHVERRVPFDVTYRIETGAGETRWFWDRGRAIWGESGIPVRMSGSIRDVTESKDGGAHGYPSSVNLHLPLRTIENFKQTLLEGSLSESGQDGTAIAARAALHGRRLAAILDDLRTLSLAMDAPLRRASVDLSALARSLTRRMRRDEPDREVAISVAGGLSAEGDPQLLEAALEELIANAWKFTSATEGARIEVGSSEESGSRSFYVRDNGAGFDPAEAGNIFDLFHRLHPVEEFDGAGVGLAIVRHVVRRHGGKVWAEGREGEGAAVHFSL